MCTVGKGTDSFYLKIKYRTGSVSIVKEKNINCSYPPWMTAECYNSALNMCTPNELLLK